MQSRGTTFFLGAAALAALSVLPVSAQTNPNADTADFVMTNFESPPLSTPFWGYWFTYTDRNSASAMDSTIMGNSYLPLPFDSSGISYYDTLGILDPKIFPIGHT